MSESVRVRAAGLAATFVCCLALLLPQPVNAQNQWTQVGTGDFNGDGTADVLLRDNAGRLAVQLYQGFTLLQSGVVGRMSGNWSVAAVADFNGDGRADILFHNKATGAVREWQMNGLQITNSTIVGNMSPSATVTNVGDFNGDGRADIVWTDPMGGQTEWLMNGTQVRSFMVDPNTVPWLYTLSPSQGNGFTHFYWGGSVGSLGFNNVFTNGGQFSLCPPFPAICIQDMTPSPVASSDSGGIAGNVLLGYRHAVLTESLIIGAEGFFGGGGGDIRYTGIPGTFGPGGIVSAAGASGDSVTLRPGWNAGILGQIGTTFRFGAVPFFVAFDAGVGFQHVDLSINCTGAAGACGANGILLQSLTTSSTLTGSLFGGEIDTKLGAILPVTGLNLGFLNNATVGFQYLHGNYGALTTTLGNPTQLQLITSQKVTTDSAMAKITFRMFENESPVPRDRAYINYDYFSTGRR
jgi:hypothetical protein